MACVARPLKATEIRENPAAQLAMDTEYNRLRFKKHRLLDKPGCWDEDLVEEMASVKHRARAANITMHFGIIFGICVEKGSELPAGHPGKNQRERCSRPELGQSSRS